MKKIIITAVALAMLPAVAGAKSFKRGIAENQFAIEGQMAPIAPGVSWYYNWGSAPGTGYEDQVKNFTGYEYIPMCWNGINAQVIRDFCAQHPECRYILAFNEPNFVKQANLTPAQAAAKWPELKALAAELNLQIVAPALNYSPDAPYQNPVTWMDEFVNLVGLDAFDYTAIHNYGGLGVMKTLAGTFHEKYGKPVWVTEWCFWPGGAGDVYVAPATQISSMIETVEWLEKTDYIYRYAWFKCIGAHNSSNKPNYGLEITANGLGERQLSPQGWVYTYMTDFDPNVWNAVDTPVAASEYISSKAVLLEKSNDPECPRPIEISQFTSGAYADYQFDVPAAGTYNLVLKVSGQGEPTRFDPSLKISLVNADGTAGAQLAARQFTLSGDNEVYTRETFKVDLPAGHVTVRVADANPYQPSGIRISTVTLSDVTGIEAVDANRRAEAVDVYTLTGVKVKEQVLPSAATEGLAPGFYIVGGEKKLVR